jgi:hypothetical protein
MPRDFLVFLCHASGDKPAVRALYQRLQADGFQSWLDEEHLLPGQDWQHEITAAVRSSSVVLVCLSRVSVTKEGFVQKEIKQALDVADEKPEGSIFIIPVRLEDCDVPMRLRRWHWVNLYEGSGYTRLLSALRTRHKTTAGQVTLGEEVEDQIRRVLAATGGNKSKAAQILGIERKTLYRKLERMDVERKSDNAPAQAGKPRVLVSHSGSGLIVTNCGPRLFGVNFKSHPVEDMVVKFEPVPALAENASIPLTFSIVSTDGKTNFACGLEVIVLAAPHSMIPVIITCQDGQRRWWEGVGGLVFDQSARQWNSAGFDEMRELPLS